MVVQVLAGVARGAVTGARVVGKAAATAVRAGAKGTSSALKETEKGARTATRTATTGAKAGLRTANQVTKAGYRAGRAFSRVAQDARSSEEIKNYGYSTHGNPKRFSVGDPRRSLVRASNAIQAPIPRFARRMTYDVMPAGTKRVAEKMGLIQRAPRWARRQQLKNKALSAAGLKGGPAHPPISKMEGRVMLGVAIIFDFLPLLLIVLPIAAFMVTAGSNPGCELNWSFFSCVGGLVLEGVGGAAAIAAIIFFSPFIYMIGSVFSVLVGSLVFVVWIGALRGVNPMRVLIYLPLEMVPLINLLPFFTRGVWKTLRIVERDYAQIASAI